MNGMRQSQEPVKETKSERMWFLKWVGWLVVLVVIWMLYNAAVQNNPGLQVQPQSDTVNVHFKASVGPNIILDKPVTVEKGANAFEEMKKVADVQYKVYAGMGALIESIEGIGAEGKEFWALYINGEQSSVGISDVVLDEDMLIEWRLETFE